MFESFGFSTSPLISHPPSGISHTNPEICGHGAALSNTRQSPPSMSDLVTRLRAQTLDSSHTSQTCSPVRTEYTPVEDFEIEFSSPFSPTNENFPPNYTFAPPIDRGERMVHPNILSSFHPRTTDQCSRRTQRQILQQQQCKPAFTRDLKQLLQKMVEKQDQCKITTSPPPPSRGRMYRTTSLSISSTVRKKEDQGFYVSDKGSTSSGLPFQTPSSKFSSTPNLRSPTKSKHSQRSTSEIGKGVRHRRVASEGNIDIAFDTDDANCIGGRSLRRAGAPVGIVKLGRQRGRGDLAPRPTACWRQHISRIRRRSREQRLDDVL